MTKKEFGILMLLSCVILAILCFDNLKKEKINANVNVKKKTESDENFIDGPGNLIKMAGKVKTVINENSAFVEITSASSSEDKVNKGDIVKIIGSNSIVKTPDYNYYQDYYELIEGDLVEFYIDRVTQEDDIMDVIILDYLTLKKHK